MQAAQSHFVLLWLVLKLVGQEYSDCRHPKHYVQWPNRRRLGLRQLLRTPKLLKYNCIAMGLSCVSVQTLKNGNQQRFYDES